MCRAILAMMLLILSSLTGAVYNDNYSGKIAAVLTYADGDYIYFTLENQPTSHPTCRPEYFVIADTVPCERRQMLLSRLLTAYATKETVNIGFDNAGDCVHGFIRVHRVG